jgi:hypothetical protein
MYDGEEDEGVNVCLDRERDRRKERLRNTTNRTIYIQNRKIRLPDRQGASKFKTRRVAKGYSLREGIDFTETYAPVSKMATHQTLLTIAADEDFETNRLSYHNSPRPVTITKARSRRPRAAPIRNGQRTSTSPTSTNAS